MSVTEPGLEPELGLRERKRRATKSAIQQAALRIAIEHGLAAVTVDEVSRRADVSPRTFFNYFPSKDHALLGEDPTLPTGEVMDAFVTGLPTGDLIADVGVLLTHSTQELVEDRDLLPERQQVLKENPQLFGQRMASMKEFQAQLAAVVIQRLEHEAAVGAGTVEAGSATDASKLPETPTERVVDPAIERGAGVVSLVARATIRHAWWDWSRREDDDMRLVDCVRASFDDLGSLVSRTAV